MRATGETRGSYAQSTAAAVMASETARRSVELLEEGRVGCLPTRVAASERKLRHWLPNRLLHMVKKSEGSLVTPAR